MIKIIYFVIYIMNSLNNKTLQVMNQPIPSKKSKQSIFDVFTNNNEGAPVEASASQKNSNSIFSIFSAPEEKAPTQNVLGSPQNVLSAPANNSIFSVFTQKPKSVQQLSSPKQDLMSSPKQLLTQEIHGEPKGFIDSINKIFSNKSTPKVAPTAKLEDILVPNGAASSKKMSSVSETPMASMFSGFNWMIWLVVLIIVLGFLGINVFNYLAEGTTSVAEKFSKLLAYFGIKTAEASQQILDTSIKGTEAGLKFVGGAAAGAVSGGVEAAKPKSSQPTTPVETSVAVKRNYNSSLDREIDEADRKSAPTPDVAKSSAHSNEAGWCYVGDDRGYRVCGRVNDANDCMSGDIFPSKDICINPNLRK